ncbi:type 2 lantipeptide synthetase LanM family protein [Nostoc sp. CENA67]|uniref:Type 2 lantipeptide synthetase LanM family protein n=1 Tax=Amazonocrinis nigriterrae CENA67 TaxID=2794033 RepID=A0A8J7HTJ9_9NOST|nr:type 2 lanthipeptide synthetase LanM family protein [Amazonocrinis nigriterrae]MBH8562239.1 type 2 lantipeptide synthetase LanM family protein [Amazonocrinis nigriterrae CENA67]
MKFSHQDLLKIIARSSTITERLSDDFFVSEEQNNSSVVNSRLEKWCQVAAEGNWEKFQQRLAWDGLDVNTVRRVLGTIGIKDQQEIPGWAETLNQCLQATALIKLDFSKEKTLETNRCLDSQKPLPFEEILLPFIYVAREKLSIQTGANYGLLSNAAHACLERGLLEWLALVCVHSMELEFSIFRATKQSTLVRLLSKSTTQISKHYYQDFINNLLTGGLLKIFMEYPVLARLMATATDLWIDNNREFISRLASDWSEIQTYFQPDTELQQVIAVQPNLSDRHSHGNSVMAITFDSGLKLIYKPKNLALEQAYFEILEWINQQNILLPFKLIKVMNRSIYGWVEFVETVPCQNQKSAKRYYQRVGMLLCLTYILDATDLHYENIIACDEHPVLIDLETLMHPWVKSAQDLQFANSALHVANQQMWHSVLRSGLLPQWEQGLEGQVRSVGGLRDFNQQEEFSSVLALHHINSDAMILSYENQNTHNLINSNTQNEIYLLLNDYSAEIIKGFSQMYNFLLIHKLEITQPNSLLQKLNHQIIRFVFRPTSIYALVLKTTLQPRCLRDGAEQSIQLDILSRAMLLSKNKPLFWPLLKVEQQALAQMDIPLFAACSDSNALKITPNQIIDNLFIEPSFSWVIDRVNQLNNEDLERQIGFIKGALYAYSAHEIDHFLHGEKLDIPLDSTNILTHDQILQQAIAIATDLQKQAIRSADGSTTWIAPQYIPELRRFQLQPLDYSLFDGIFGTALFLAALEKIIPGTGFRELARGALQSFHKDLQSSFFDQFAKQFTISGAVGCCSLIYVLVRISQFLAEPEFLEDAKKIASLITSDMIAADQKFDIISGAAGAILGLLALYNITTDQEILYQALDCGHHLLKNRVTSDSGCRTWATIEGELLTGVSHGAAGIAYALLSLYQVTDETAFREAAQEAIAYERSVFIDELGNWPDLRSSPIKADLTPKCDWSHGAAGIGLVRVAGLSILDTNEIRRDIEVAIKTTQKYQLDGVDNLCNGNFGRIEFLFTAGRKLNLPELIQTAMEQATQVVTRAKHRGGFAYGSALTFHPGFFQGTAGIGYQLLRLAYPDQFPSVLLWE